MNNQVQRILIYTEISFYDTPWWKGPRPKGRAHFDLIWPISTKMRFCFFYGRWHLATVGGLKSTNRGTFEPTRSSSACHVWPLALKRLIYFASIIGFTHFNTFELNWNSFEQIWTHLITFEQVLNKFEHVWTYLNTFEHIWTHLSRFWTGLSTF